MTSESDQSVQSLRNILFPFVLVLVISIAIIATLTVIAARSQNQAAVETSVHLTRSVIADIERRLGEQLLDYSFWDTAVANLVETPNLNWADRNVGIYMHERFDISTSFVVDATNRSVYAMVDGKRVSARPQEHFSGGFASLLAATRSQPKNQPPTPLAGILTDGEVAHIAAVSTLTTFSRRSAPGADIATGSTLIFTRAIDADLLKEISRNYLLRDLKFVPGTQAPADAALPLITVDGTLVGHLTWTPEALGDELLENLLPFVTITFLIFGVSAFVFFRRTQRIAANLTLDNLALKSARNGLREAKEVAEQANRSKTLFLANMSHELRTPLNSIIGFSEVLKDQVFGKMENPRYLSYAADINGAGKHLLNLINDILDVSKIEADELEIADELLDPVKLANDCISLVRNHADAETVILGLEHDRDLPWLVGDEVRIKQVLINLLTNAIKFTLAGGRVTLHILVNDSSIRFAVEDTGIGIAADDMPRVLAPFQQVRSDHAVAGEGTGLGVHLSKRIMELHGGSLSITSELGKGTTVYVEFPPERTVPDQ